MKKKLLVVVIACAGVGAVVWYWQTRQASPQTAATVTTKTTTQAKSSPGNSVRFYAMGDMLPHDSVVAQAKQGEGYNFADYFSAIKPLYADADAVFCNPEASVSGDTYGVSG